MRKHVVLVAGIAVFSLFFATFFESPKRFIWNRTDSAPVGLYWLNNAPFSHGNWVIVSASSDQALWAQSQGFVGADWPLIKQVAGLPGDEICRNDETIEVNKVIKARALDVDARGRELPDWSGCRVLGRGEIFLLNTHPRSLDGRYFGVTKFEDVDGSAVLLFEMKR